MSFDVENQGYHSKSNSKYKEYETKKPHGPPQHCTLTLLALKYFPDLLNHVVGKEQTNIYSKNDQNWSGETFGTFLKAP